MLLDCLKAHQSVLLGTTYSRQKFSGLSWMVKRYYIQDYPENVRGNTETRAIASDFIRPSTESSLTRWEKKNAHPTCGEGRWLFTSCYITWTRLENSDVGTKKNYMEAFDIFHALWWSFYVILAHSSELGSWLAS